MNRNAGTDILSLSNEDFELVGIDPTTISDDQFERIVDALREHYNEGFSDVLSEIVKTVSEGK